MSRATHGVKGISLHDGDYVVAMDVVHDEAPDVLSVTENGIGKRTKISKYKVDNDLNVKIEAVNPASAVR